MDPPFGLTDPLHFGLAAAVLLLLLASTVLGARWRRESALVDRIDAHPNTAVYPTELQAERGAGAAALRRLQAAGVLRANRQGAMSLEPPAWALRRQRWLRMLLVIWLAALLALGCLGWMLQTQPLLSSTVI